MKLHPVTSAIAPAPVIRADRHPTAPALFRRAILCAILAASALLTGCETRGQSALLGAALGGGAGYLVGSSTHGNRDRSHRNDYHRSPTYRSRTHYTPSRSYRS